MELQPNEIASWSFEDTVVDGRVTIDKPSKKLLHAVAAAEAAGVLKVKASKDERAVMASAVESDADSLKAQQKAQADGSWHVGNHEAYLTQSRQLLAGDVADTTRSQLEAQIPVSEAYLAARADGDDHDTAIVRALNG